MPGQRRRGFAICERARPNGEPVTATDDTTPTIADVDRLVPGWTPRARTGARSSTATSRGQPERDLRAAPGDLHAAMRIRATAPAERDAASSRVADHRGADRTDVPHTEAVAVCTDPAVLADLLPDGFVDGWSPWHGARRVPEPSTPTSSPAGLPTSWWRHRLLSKVDWKAKGLEDLGRPDGFTSAGGPLDRLLRAHQGRELPGFDEASAWLRAHKPLDYIRDHARRLPVRQRDVQGRGRRGSPIVDWEMGTVGDPKLTWLVVHTWPRTPVAARQRRRLRRHDRHAVAASAPALLEQSAARSTTSTTTACWPSGSWRRARAGYQRPGRPQAQGFGGGARPHGRRSELAESSDYKDEDAGSCST